MIDTTTESTAVKSLVKKLKRVVSMTTATGYRHMYIKRCHFKFKTRSDNNMTHNDVIIMKLRHFTDCWGFSAYNVLLHLITPPVNLNTKFAPTPSCTKCTTTTKYMKKYLIHSKIRLRHMFTYSIYLKAPLAPPMNTNTTKIVH